MIQSPPALLNLADLSQRIDIKGFYESHGVTLAEKPSTNRTDGTEWHGNCPECGGTDRFAFWQSGRFSCSIRDSGCGIHGNSPYFFLRDVKGYTHQQALEELGISQEEVGDSYHRPAPKLPLFLISDEPPCAQWQDAAYVFCHMAEKCLWGPKGETARNYLHSRGFSDATIKEARLGLCPDWWKAPLEDWGLSAEQLGKEEDPQIKIPRGITIPWFVGSSIHKIQLRRPDGGYFEVRGSSECLYSLAPLEDRPVLLVESEFDALAAHQEAGDLITAVATGGTPKGRNPRNLMELRQASMILQAFDDDEPGERAAAEWQELIPTIIRHTPWSHDVNDMLREDPESIRIWVELGLSNMEPERGEDRSEFFQALVHQEAAHLLSKIPSPIDRAGKEIPPALIERVPDLVGRVLAFQDACIARGKICCNTLEWTIDVDGLLVCPCIIKARETNRLLDLRIAQEQARKRSPVALMDW